MGLKVGRPSLYTPELADAICERVVMRSLHDVSSDADMPDEATIYTWLRKHAEFHQNYTRSREIRAFRRAEGADTVVKDMRAGVIDSQMARVELDAIKWQTGRENPKAFGDKLDMNLSGTVQNQTDEQLAERIALMQAKLSQTDGDI